MAMMSHDMKSHIPACLAAIFDWQKDLERSLSKKEKKN
jgi:hypothetical protein